VFAAVQRLIADDKLDRVLQRLAIYFVEISLVVDVDVVIVVVIVPIPIPIPHRRQHLNPVALVLVDDLVTDPFHLRRAKHESKSGLVAKHSRSGTFQMIRGICTPM